MPAQTASDTRLRPFEAMRAVRTLIATGDTSQVFVIFRAMRGRSGVRSFQRFAASPVGQAVLKDRRDLYNALTDRAHLRQMPPDVELFRRRMRELHDVTHTVTGYGRDQLGELCLLTFMYRQQGNLGML